MQWDECNTSPTWRRNVGAMGELFAQYYYSIIVQLDFVLTDGEGDIVMGLFGAQSCFYFIFPQKKILQNNHLF